MFSMIPELPKLSAPPKKFTGMYLEGTLVGTGSVLGVEKTDRGIDVHPPYFLNDLLCSRIFQYFYIK